MHNFLYRLSATKYSSEPVLVRGLGSFFSHKIWPENVWPGFHQEGHEPASAGQLAQKGSQSVQGSTTSNKHFLSGKSQDGRGPNRGRMWRTCFAYITGTMFVCTIGLCIALVLFENVIYDIFANSSRRLSYICEDSKYPHRPLARPIISSMIDTKVRTVNTTSNKMKRVNAGMGETPYDLLKKSSTPRICEFISIRARLIDYICGAHKKSDPPNAPRKLPQRRYWSRRRPVNFNCKCIPQ